MGMRNAGGKLGLKPHAPKPILEKQEKNTMKNAISYKRWSSPEQSAGNSAARQTDGYGKFCEAFKLAQGQSYTDSGLSGFHGTHKSKGKLGEILQAIKSGSLPKGTTLVIENWDRLDRSRPDKSFQVVAEILSAGIDIGVVSLWQIFTETDLGRPQVQMIFADLTRSHMESKWKSERQKDNIQRRRAEKRKGKNCPSWLTLENGEYVLNSKASKIREAIQLAIGGYGYSRIEAKLGLGRGLLGMLRSPTLLGYYQPRKRTNNREKDGEPIALYPAIVSETDWHKLQAALDARRNHVGKRGEFETNLLSGLCWNADDGQPMIIRKWKRAMLTSQKCKGTKSLRYEVLESAVLAWVKEIKPEELTEKQPAAVDTLEGKVAAIKHKISEAAERLAEDGGNVGLLAGLQALGTALKAAQRALETTKRQQADPRLNEVVTLTDLLAKVRGEKLLQVRSAIKQAIRSLVREVWIKVESSTRAIVQITLTNGMIRTIFADREGAKCWQEDCPRAILGKKMKIGA